jgi:tRNA threonylcarbamoyladenosine biosynthesis protein TsaB
MTVLAIECSTLAGGVALAKGERVFSSETWSEQSRHGEFVVSGIQKLFERNKMNPKDVDVIAVDIGPGRFTGVRVAINAARTLAYSLDKPIAAIDSLSVMAGGCENISLPLLTILNAHKNMVFAAAHSYSNGRWVQTFKPEALTIPELERRIGTPHLCIGDGFSVYESTMSPEFKRILVRDSHLSDYPKVEALAKLAQSSPLKSWREIEPLYIRASEAEEKLKTGLITGI